MCIRDRYIIFDGDDYPPSIDLLCGDRIRVFSETYALIDTQKNKIITNRVLAAYVIDNKVYALGAGEYVIYDMDIGKEKVYIQDANMKQARNIYRKSFGMAERENVFSYSEFTEEEQRGFQAMFMNPHKRGAVYYKPFYNSCYKAGLIDTQKLAEVDIIGDDWRIVNDVFYAYGYDSFIIITGHGEKIRQYYNPELTLNKMVIDEDKYHKIDKKKALYGSRYSVLADINEFTPEEIEILHSLWKESFLRRVPEEKEKEQEKEMDRVWHKIRTEE